MRPQLDRGLMGLSRSSQALQRAHDELAEFTEPSGKFPRAASDRSADLKMFTTKDRAGNVLETETGNVQTTTVNIPARTGNVLTKMGSIQKKTGNPRIVPSYDDSPDDDKINGNKRNDKQKAANQSSSSFSARNPSAEKGSDGKNVVENDWAVQDFEPDVL
jgi:hypothetical protein